MQSKLEGLGATPEEAVGTEEAGQAVPGFLTTIHPRPSCRGGGAWSGTRVRETARPRKRCFLMCFVEVVGGAPRSPRLEGGDGSWTGRQGPGRGCGSVRRWPRPEAGPGARGAQCKRRGWFLGCVQAGRGLRHRRPAPATLAGGRHLGEEKASIFFSAN